MEDLDDLVKEIVTHVPSCDMQSIKTLLKVNCVILQRVRESIHRVDPFGLETRLCRTLHHRQYNVASPNALWHINGHHKLIRWQLVIHGGRFFNITLPSNFVWEKTDKLTRPQLEAYFGFVILMGLPSYHDEFFHYNPVANRIPQDRFF